MLLFSRHNPPKLGSIPRPPLESSSSVESVKRFLLNSPLPSPALPSIRPRHDKKPQKLDSTRAVRLVTWLMGVALFVWLASRILETERSPTAINYLSSDGKSYEIIGQDTLPEYPSPIVVTDKRGRSKWTVSIPSDLDFPLRPHEYSDICTHAQDVAMHVADLKTDVVERKIHTAHYGYYHQDPNFMDIAEAERHGLLPLPPKTTTSSSGSSPKICDRSLTYVLESTGASFGATLLGLWLAYGLAQHENRAFFIDDTRFPYGNYSTFFNPPPTPSCIPPPKPHRIPCPHQARHLVASAATAPSTFGHAFNDAFEDGHKMGVERQEKIFAMLRAGYEALFHLNRDDDASLTTRIEELRSSDALEVAIHIRHGDRHPFTFQYSKSYIPVHLYLEAAGSFTLNSSTTSPRLLLASDDPDVYLNPEILAAAHTERAQSAIVLGSKRTLGSPGFEGGWFRNAFWAMGMPQSSERRRDGPAPTRNRPGSQGLHFGRTEQYDPVDHPTSDAVLLRGLVGRAYLLDLAVMAQADRIVCTVSSSTCRVLAVMMGWKKAVKDGGWRNVDGEWGWRGLDW